jgi:hypothetical protein
MQNEKNKNEILTKKLKGIYHLLEVCYGKRIILNWVTG